MKVLCFFITIHLVHTAVDTRLKWISLKGKAVSTEDPSAEGVFAIDGDVSTHVTVTSDTASLVVDLRSFGSSEVWFIDSVWITPARPPSKTGTTGKADNNDTGKCIFPFRKNNKPHYKCMDSGFGFMKCSYGKHIEISDWSSCNGYQPDGHLSDNIVVSVSLSNNSKNLEYCGTTDSSSFNAIRKVKCPQNLTRYLSFNKVGNMRIAEINVKAYSYDIDHGISGPAYWKEGSIANTSLSISGGDLPFIIPKIVWYHQPLDRKTLPGVISAEEEFSTSTITRQTSGYYHFEYTNSMGDTFYKSDSVKMLVYYQSDFLSELESKYSVISGEHLKAICAVVHGYPHPNITMTLGDTSLSCDYIIKEDKYGGMSVSCSVDIPIESEHNNEQLICRVEQGDEDEYAQESIATVIVRKPGPTPRPPLLSSPLPNPLFLLFLLLLIPICIVLYYYRKSKNGIYV